MKPSENCTSDGAIRQPGFTLTRVITRRRRMVQRGALRRAA
jgi:hypothetical protein